MIILFTFISLLGGLAYGIFGFHIPAVSLILKNTDGVLYALMFFVGISIGMHRGILSKIREYHIKIFIIPAGIIAGSIVGGSSVPASLKFRWGRELPLPAEWAGTVWPGRRSASWEGQSWEALPL